MTESKNPLFPDEDSAKLGFALPGKPKTIQPLPSTDSPPTGANAAADMIREKLERLYATEPDALAEEKEVESIPTRSPHQQFMYELSTSGKSLAEIQTQWHNYYVALPDDQKHQVWQEFYENNATRSQPALHEPAPKQAKQLITSHADRADQSMVVADHTPPEQPRADKRPLDTIRTNIRAKVADRADKIPDHVKQNAKSLLFGLTSASIVLLIFLFSFFNEVIIAPFIQPSRANATPIIVNSESVDASTTKVIIPKINVEIPVVYDLADSSEATIQKGLEDGVIHYPTTPRPGQKGNAAFFGHSSNNIFNKGHYKFAFTLLHKLEVGDTYYLTYNNTVYGYKVISTKVVSPSQVDVLYSVPGHDATATLITCDPPGTSLNRLVVVGEQVSPDPTANTEATPADTSSSPQALTGNGPSLWSRMWNSIF